MKLTARDIDGFLKAPDAKTKAVLIYGPDPGLVHARARQIAAHILGPSPDPLNRVEITPEQLKAEPALLYDELASLSLMGGRRVVMLKDVTDKLAPTIQDAFVRLNTATYLIIEAENLTPSSGLRGLFEREPAFAALPCYHDEGRGLDDVIRAAFAEAKLRIAPDAVQFLASHMGSDRGVTQGELTRILLYLGTDLEPTVAHLRPLVAHNASESTEDICHAVAAGQGQAAHMLLMRLMNEGIQPVPIIRALLRHFQRLEWVKKHIENGASPDEAIASLRPPVFFKAQPVLKREAARWHAGRLAQVLALFLRAERDAKSSLLAPSLTLAQAVQTAARLAG